MTRRAVVLFLLAAAPAAAQPRVQPDLAANAALKYWQAFIQLPPRDDAQQKRLGDWRTTPLDDAARKLVGDGEKSLLYLRRGAALPRCDWSLDYDDGIGLLLPHLDKARTLTLFACLKARIALQDGAREDALENLLAAMTMGRHVADPIMVCLLVDHVIELNAIDAIALMLPELNRPVPNPAALQQLAKRLELLPTAGTIDQTIITERDYFGGWAIRWLKRMETQIVAGKLEGKDMRAMVKALLLGSEDSDEIMKLVDDRSAARLIKALEGLGPFYEEQRRLAALPRDQFDAQWPQAQKKVSADPLARLLLPALNKVIDARDRGRARTALLKAAVAVVRDGQGALANHPDPFGKGPFQYAARPKGFELRSALTQDGKPVTLVVGPRD